MDSRNLLCGHCGPRIANLSCERCGLPLCHECRVEGRCPACARDLALWRRRGRRLVLTVAVWLIPGALMACTAGCVLKRANHRHACHQALAPLWRQVSSIQDRLSKHVSQDPARPADDPVPVGPVRQHYRPSP